VQSGRMLHFLWALGMCEDSYDILNIKEQEQFSVLYLMKLLQ
jgi:hypothetical protein